MVNTYSDEDVDVEKNDDNGWYNGVDQDEETTNIWMFGFTIEITSLFLVVEAKTPIRLQKKDR